MGTELSFLLDTGSEMQPILFGVSPRRFHLELKKYKGLLKIRGIGEMGAGIGGPFEGKNKYN